MIDIRINSDDAQRQLRRAFELLGKDNTALALARGINRSASKGRTLASRSIREQYNIKASDLAKSLIAEKASRTTLEGKVTAFGKALPLGYFAPRKTQTGISISIKRGQRDIVQRAFFMPAKSRLVVARGRYANGDFVFRRKRVKKTGADLPLTALLTTSVPRAFKDQDTLASLVPPLEAYFADRIYHEVAYLLSRMAGAGRI